MFDSLDEPPLLKIVSRGIYQCPDTTGMVAGQLNTTGVVAGELGQKRQQLKLNE